MKHQASTYTVTIDGTDREVTFGPDGLEVDGTTLQSTLHPVGGRPGSGRAVVHIDETAHVVAYTYEPAGAEAGSVGRWRLSIDGRPTEAVVLDERERTIREMVGAAAAARGPEPVKAPMPGLVVKVDVAEGDAVEGGQGVVVVEAMKMENELQAHGPGLVERIHVAPGDTVEKDQVLVEFSKVEDE